MKDVQGEKDKRNIGISEVGISDFLYPINICIDNNYHNTVAKLDMYVYLKSDKRGTHMSRFVEILSEYNKFDDIEDVNSILLNLQNRLESYRTRITMNFPIFMLKQAPISKKNAFDNINIELDAILDNNKIRICVTLDMNVMTLCPCSKEISSYGAHNQRARVRVKYNLSNKIFLQPIIDIVENSASSGIYPLLKREDEKYVTEVAYENPKFVEDLCRDISLNLNKNDIMYEFIEVKSFESIHNHNAIARIFNE